MIPTELLRGAVHSIHLSAAPTHTLFGSSGDDYVDDAMLGWFEIYGHEGKCICSSLGKDLDAEEEVSIQYQMTLINYHF